MHRGHISERRAHIRAASVAAAGLPRDDGGKKFLGHSAPLQFIRVAAWETLIISLRLIAMLKFGYVEGWVLPRTGFSWLWAWFFVAYSNAT